MDDSVLIISIAFAITAVFMAIIFLVIKRKSQRGLGSKKEAPTAETNQLRHGRWSGQAGNVDYKYQFTRGSKNHPPSLKISVECKSPGSFQIKKETAFDRFFKKIGLCKEIQTQDEQFDKKYYISSDTVPFTTYFFSKSKNRQVVDQLQGMGFNEVVHNGKEMMVRCVPFRPKSGYDVSRLDQAATLLNELTQNIPLAPSPETFSDTPWKRNRILAFAVPILLDIIAFTALIVGLVTYRPLDGFPLVLESLKYSVPSLVFFTWFAFQLLKGRSSSHREFIVVFMLSIFGFLMAGAGGAVFLNGYLDKSDPMLHETVVVDKYISRSDKSKSYYMRVQSWRPGEKTERVRVSYSEYRRIEPDKTEVSVTTRSGRFGYEWLVGFELHLPRKE